MVIPPDTELYLIKSPLELSINHQITFSTKQEQSNYFLSLPKIKVVKFTYQRKNNIIRYPALIDDIMEYNYVMYKNSRFSNKWFYAFIENMTFMNLERTDIQIKTDVWQTWQFDLHFNQSFIEREHVNDDTAGLHTVPENLELGEYEIVDLRNSPMFETGNAMGDWWVAFCVTKLPASTTGVVNGNVKDTHDSIGNVFNSMKMFATQLISARHVIEAFENDSSITSEAIINIYMIPRCCVDVNTTNGNIASTGNTPSTLSGYSLYPIYNSYTSDVYELQQPQVLAENYQPVNKKLLSYPYSYFYVSNNTGEDIIFHYEDFPFETIGQYRRRTMSYKKSYVPSASISAKLYFTNYKGYSEQDGYGTKLYNYGINFAKVPVCAWTTDYYTNWLTQNGVNVATSAITGIGGGLFNMGLSAVGGNAVGIAGSALSLIGAIGNTMGQIQQASTTPDQAHGNYNTGDLIFSYLRNSISFYEMSIRPEYARIIDKYFSTFGYKINDVKVPNITGRRNWNYVKTIGCNVIGEMPDDDLIEIKQMFDNGITLWHNPNTFLDYSQNNNIM